jgi:hypothetical protein
VIVATLALAAFSVPSDAQSLSGSWGSMNRQVQEAARHDYTYIQSPSQLQRFVEAGYLVPMRGNKHYFLKEVSYPYARPEVRSFVELLSKSYFEGCGEQLVVTSLTRPVNKQPRNASSRSVHPTGMALDLRRSWTYKCRRWLEQTMLRLEANQILDITLERNPYHYHVALFPRAFRQRGAKVLANNSSDEYYVTSGDTLWKIAKRYDTSVDMVKAMNGLRNSIIRPGQRLKIPAGR